MARGDEYDESVIAVSTNYGMCVGVQITVTDYNGGVFFKQNVMVGFVYLFAC